MTFLPKVTLTLALVTLVSMPVKAAQSGDFFFSLSLASYNITKVTRGRTASKSFLGQTYLPLSLRCFVGLFEGLHFSPYLSTTHITTLIFPVQTPEKGLKKDLLFLGLPFTTASEAGEWDVTFGPGLFVYHLQGKGGSTELRNGDSTATFGLPKRSKMTKNWYLDLGVGYNGEDRRFDFDIFFVSPFTQRRSYTMMFTLAFNLASGY